MATQNYIAAVREGLAPVLELVVPHLRRIPYGHVVQADGQISQHSLGHILDPRSYEIAIAPAVSSEPPRPVPVGNDATPRFSGASIISQSWGPNLAPRRVFPKKWNCVDRKDMLCGQKFATAIYRVRAVPSQEDDQVHASGCIFVYGNGNWRVVRGVVLVEVLGEGALVQRIAVAPKGNKNGRNTGSRWDAFFDESECD